MAYLDYNSTTSVDSRIVGIMIPIFNEWFGNPSSVSHETGRRKGIVHTPSGTAKQLPF